MTERKTEVRRLYLDSNEPWVVDILEVNTNINGYVQPDGTAGAVYKYDNKSEALLVASLYCSKHVEETVEVPTSAGEKGSIRKFETGATRDTVEGKLSYTKILSPVALRKYVQYMTRHAKQSDGSMREPDNWKAGFPEDVYLDSLERHLVAVWLLHQGFTESDNHGPVTLEDSLCGILFNAFGWLHERLKKE